MSWQPIKTAPRDGTNILLAWGQDGVSQGKYIPGLPKPWQFIDTNDGITWIINHAVDNEYGPTHWMPIPRWTKRAPAATVREFTNELGNRIRITIEGPTSTSENVLTPIEATALRCALLDHDSAPGVTTPQSPQEN